jgi:hypothetical protein
MNLNKNETGFGGFNWMKINVKKVKLKRMMAGIEHFMAVRQLEDSLLSV